jgi:hypothetical protein
VKNEFGLNLTLEPAAGENWQVPVGFVNVFLLCFFRFPSGFPRVSGFFPGFRFFRVPFEFFGFQGFFRFRVHLRVKPAPEPGSVLVGCGFNP